MPKDLFIAWPEFENALAEELGSNAVRLTDESFQVSANSIKITPAFARQVLPGSIILEYLSIKQTAQRILELVPKEGSWRVHFCDAKKLGDFELSGRGKLINDALIELLRKNDRYGLKRMLESTEKSQTLIQYFSLSKSISALSTTESFYPDGLVIESGCGGQVLVEEDKRPPARAYRKLKEALLIADLKIGEKETVVDLGSSPGSWAWVCLENGARVVAVDRTELESKLMNNRRLRFVQGDAFNFKPEEPVEWLISDVIASPERITKLLQDWLNGRRMKKFCVTLKFKGEERAKHIAALRKVLKGTQYLIRHLENNKNEVTAIGLV